MRPRVAAFAAVCTAVILTYGSLGAAPVVYAAESYMDMDYEGEVDIYSGAPAGGAGESSENLQLVALTDGGSFDRTTHTFVYTAPNQASALHATVADGMVVTGAVSLTADEGLSIEVYRDGTQLSGTDFSQLSGTGSYTVLASGGEQSPTLMEFTIVAENTGELDRYEMPKGFYVKELVYNGQDVSDFETGAVDLTQEGVYKITYRCRATAIDYQLRLSIDHTAPGITLTGVTGGIAHGPVTIEGVGEGETLTVLRDGEEVSLVLGNVLRTAGSYTVRVADDAGNVTEESFTIRMYLNYQSISFFALAFAIIAAAGVYMYLSRKRLRVR